MKPLSTACLLAPPPPRDRDDIFFGDDTPAAPARSKSRVSVSEESATCLVVLVTVNRVVGQVFALRATLHGTNKKSNAANALMFLMSDMGKKLSIVFRYWCFRPWV